MLTFIETEIGEYFTAPMPAYNNKSIQHLLIHNADCYLYWLAYMALDIPVDWLDYGDYKTVADIRRLFTRMDDIMDVFLEKFDTSLHVPVDNARTRSDKLTATPLMIFTHAITHEFHHKGQVVAMCRQQGYPPPETDMQCFFQAIV